MVNLYKFFRYSNPRITWGTNFTHACLMHAKVGFRWFAWGFTFGRFGLMFVAVRPIPKAQPQENTP